jgi:hypothetical protein
MINNLFSNLASLVGLSLLVCSSAANAQGKNLITNSPYSASSPDNPYGDVGSPYGSQNANNPYSEVGSPYGATSKQNPYSEVSSPYGSLSPSNPYSEVSSPYGSLSPSNPYSEVASPYGALVESRQRSGNKNEIIPPLQQSVVPSVNIKTTPVEIETRQDSVRTADTEAFISNSAPVPEFSDTESRLNYLRWIGKANTQLKIEKPDWNIRREFLQTVWYESSRAGLKPSLVLGLVETVSNFRKFYIAENGARGYMSVSPNWASKLGNGDLSSLFHMQTNLRFGCVVLRHYIDRRRGDLYLALNDYYQTNVFVVGKGKTESEFKNLVFTNSRHWE